MIALTLHAKTMKNILKHSEHQLKKSKVSTSKYRENGFKRTVVTVSDSMPWKCCRCQYYKSIGVYIRYGLHITADLQFVLCGTHITVQIEQKRGLFQCALDPLYISDTMTSANRMLIEFQRKKIKVHNTAKTKYDSTLHFCHLKPAFQPETILLMRAF
jgi:hypothetical protein